MATKDIKGTRTEKLITAAYMNETQAYARYTYYAKSADKENYFPIGEIFRETAENELNHAKVFLKMLPGGQVPVTLNVDAGVIGDTATNLKISIHEETTDGVEAYLDSAKIADEEGFPEIASHFRAIASVESHHCHRFETLLEQVEAGTVWKRDEPIVWRCLVCGYLYEGKEPPEVCPGCDHPREHYMATDIE